MGMFFFLGIWKILDYQSGPSLLWSRSILLTFSSALSRLPIPFDQPRGAHKLQMDHMELLSECCCFCWFTFCVNWSVASENRTGRGAESGAASVGIGNFSDPSDMIYRYLWYRVEIMLVP